MRWLDGISDSDMNLSKLWKIVKHWEAWHAAVHEVAKSWTCLLVPSDPVYSMAYHYNHLLTILSSPVCLFAQTCLTLCNPMVCMQPTRLLYSRDSPGKNTGVGKPFPSPRDLPDLGIKPRCPALQADSLPTKPPENSLSSLTWSVNQYGKFLILDKFNYLSALNLHLSS